MYKWTFDYETGDYEYLDQNGHRFDGGGYTYNFDRSPFEDEKRQYGILGWLFGDDE